MSLLLGTVIIALGRYFVFGYLDPGTLKLGRLETTSYTSKLRLQLHLTMGVGPSSQVGKGTWGLGSKVSLNTVY